MQFYFQLCRLFAWMFVLSAAALHAEESPNIVKSVANGRVWMQAETTLAGRKVFIIQDDQANKFFLGVRVQVGYSSDPESRDGLAHFVEHLIAFGKLPTAGESFKHWMTSDQARKLWFKTEASYTNYTMYVDPRDAGALLDRFDEAITHTTYTANDVSDQLAHIDREIYHFQQSFVGQINTTVGEWASPQHSYHRQVSAGGVASLGSAASPELVAQANDFLRAHYPGNQSAIVVVSPLLPDEVIDLLKNHLKGMLSVPRTSAQDQKSNIGAPVFDSAATAKLHTQANLAKFSKAGVLVYQYALPPLKQKDQSSVLDLLHYALSNRNESSLAAALESTGYASDVNVDVSSDEIVGSVSVRLTITLTGQGAAHLSEVEDLIKKKVQHLPSSDQRDWVANYVASAEQENLLSAQVADEHLIFGLLAAVAAGTEWEALNYQVDLNAERRAEYQDISRQMAVTAPLRLNFQGSEAGKDSAKRQLARVHESKIKSSQLMTAEQRTTVAQCVVANAHNTLPCLQPYWGVAALRSVVPFLSAQQRSIAGALLRQSMANIGRQRHSTKNTLKAFAKSSPAIVVFGYGDNQDQWLDLGWKEFLRPRASEDLAALQSELSAMPNDAFDQAEQVASDRLGFSDNMALLKPIPIAELKLLVEAIQQRYRAAPTERYTTSDAQATQSIDLQLTQIPQALDALTSVSTDTASSFKTASLLEVQCETPTPLLQTMLRLTTLPSHRFALSSARSGDGSLSFGAYVTHEWGEQLCHGLSLDSDVLTPEQMRAKAQQWSSELQALYCQISPENWQAMKASTLSNENMTWSRDQSYAIEDAYNWARWRTPLLPARSVVEHAREVTSAEVCQWIKAKNSVDYRAANKASVLVMHSQ